MLQQARGRDYGGQAEHLAALIRERCPGARSLLDVACGTGQHLRHLRDHFADVAGVDLSAAMLERARLVVPDVPLEVGDMRSFRLARRFDVVICLYSSISYLLTLTEVTGAIENMASHLDPGGVLVLEAGIHPADLDLLEPRSAEAANGDGLAVSRVSAMRREAERVTTFDRYWTIASSDGVEQLTESHRLGLYSVEEYREAFEAAGLRVVHDPKGLMGRGLFIGVVGVRSPWRGALDAARRVTAQ